MPAWLAIAALLLLTASFGIAQTEKRLLASDAEQTALKYAAFIERAVPDLERLFSERTLTDEARAELLVLRQLGDVFRFKFFDSSGYTLLISDDLDADLPELASEVARLGSHHGSGNTTVSDIVLGGRNFVELADGREKPDRPDFYSEAYVPIDGSEGLLGVVEVYVDQTERQQLIGSAFAEVALIIASLLLAAGLAISWQTWQRLSDRKLGEQKIRYLAEHDALSGALNRASFERVLATAARTASASGEGFAIHCIDIDRFKEINDTLGHAAGDQVLREVTARLTTLLHPGDVVARLGGDEFAILQSTLTTPRDAEMHGRRIVETLAHPMEIDSHRVPCGASVGAACFGIDATEINDLLHKADLAMYRSKTSGRGRFSFYDEALDRELEDRRLLAIDLRTALSDKALSLHYQPLFSASNQATAIGFEALMRWEHPIRGNIPPSVFIPLAEECGHIEALGTWAIRQACHDAAAWDDESHVAVNLSPAQFRGNAADVVTIVQEALDQSGLVPVRLELEITESLLISNPEHVLQSLNRLSDLGVRIAMDDFGTGYSSLSYLWRFPFDKVKIDRAFVKELEGEGKVSVIIASIVSLAHSLGMRVNAEGVETEAQRDALRQLGCDELQGFLLGRPAPIQHDATVKQRAA